MKRFGPITLEVIRNRLDGIAAEIQATLLRSAHSVILTEGEDCSSALFNARGDILDGKVSAAARSIYGVVFVSPVVIPVSAVGCLAGPGYSVARVTGPGAGPG